MPEIVPVSAPEHVPVRMCVYTVLVGGYEALLEQPVARRSGVDLICFTDDPALSSNSWEIRLFDPSVNADPNRSSRRPKILAHEYLPDYDVSLYIDNTVLLISDPCSIIERFLPEDASMALFRHSFRSSVQEEFDTVTHFQMDAPWVFAEQLEHYTADDPGSLTAAALWGGMLFRRHHDSQVRRAMVQWWEHVLRYSRRDQLSLPYALRRTGLTPIVHEVDNYHSDFHYWPRMGQRKVSHPSTLPSGPEVMIRELQESLTAARAETELVRNAQTDQIAVALDQARSELELARAQIRQAHAETDRARADLMPMVDRIIALQEAVNGRDGLLEAGQHAVFAADAAAEDANRRAAAVLGSTSWRLTAPLRVAGRTVLALRRIFRRSSPSK